MKNLSILILGLISISLTAQSRSIEFRDLTWAETLTTAEKEGKPIFVDCYTVWCGPCKWMSANMFTKDEVADYYNKNYVCVKFDMEKGEGKEIAKKFSIRAYPTLVYTNNNEELLLVSVGASRNPEVYVDNGKRAVNPNDNMPYYTHNKVEKFSDTKFMVNYFEIMTTANKVNNDDVVNYFKQLKSDEWLSKENWTIIKMTVKSADSEVFKKVVKNDTKYIGKYGQEAEDYIGNIYYYDLVGKFYRAKSDEQIAAYTKRKNEILGSDFSGIDKVDFKINSFEYMRQKQWESYCMINVKNVDKYYSQDANELNSIAWNFFENTKNQEYLEKATLWAKQALELEQEHHIMDTYANLLFATGHPEEAFQMETKALELAKRQGADTKSYEEVIAKIEQSL